MVLVANVPHNAVKRPSVVDANQLRLKILIVQKNGIRRKVRTL